MKPLKGKKFSCQPKIPKTAFYWGICVCAFLQLKRTGKKSRVPIRGCGIRIPSSAITASRHSRMSRSMTRGPQRSPRSRPICRSMPMSALRSSSGASRVLPGTHPVHQVVELGVGHRREPEAGGEHRLVDGLDDRLGVPLGGAPVPVVQADLAAEVQHQRLQRRRRIARSNASMSACTPSFTT